MDYFTGVAGSPVFEFPYSGGHIPPSSYPNYHPNSYGYPPVSIIQFINL